MGAFERRKVNDEQWLPARATYTACARVMLVEVLRVGGSMVRPIAASSVGTSPQ